MSDVYSAKAFMSDPSENKASRKIYGSDSSFWSHVDGSWIDPKLAPKDHTEQPKKPNVVSGDERYMEDLLKRLEYGITQSPQIVSPEGLFKEPKVKVAQLTEEAKAQEEAKAEAVTIKTETPTQRASRISRMLGGLQEFLTQPSDEVVRLRKVDQEGCEDLARALGSLARKVPEFFRRTPEATPPEGETPAQRTSRIRAMFAGLNEFLTQPSDEAARLRAADRQASEDLRRALASLAKKAPDLFRRTRSIDNNPPKLPEKGGFFR